MSSQIFSQFRIVLVRTSHPGNIGSVARAIKTMRFQHLYLVSPKVFPHIKASVRAGNALDILGSAIRQATLKEAIADCHLVLGSSSRIRRLPWVCLDVREAAEMAVTKQGKVALVFGSERDGLSNKELEACHYQISIPANPLYSSLNLAAAVQVVCYEMQRAVLSSSCSFPPQEEWATVAQLEDFYRHLEQVLHLIEFLKPRNLGMPVERLRRLFSRTHLSQKEVKMLRGILSAIGRKYSE